MDKDDFKNMMSGMGEVHAYLKGDPGKTTTHHPVDVKAIRAKTRLTQPVFASTYQIPVGTVRDWEQNRYIPDATGRTLLKMIDADPEGVIKILAKAS